MFDWWLRPAFREKFSIHTLQYNRQASEWSCADWAINIIAHHVSPEVFPLLGVTLEDEIRNHIKLLWHIVYEFKGLVCTFPKLCDVLQLMLNCSSLVMIFRYISTEHTVQLLLKAVIAVMYQQHITIGIHYI